MYGIHFRPVVRGKGEEVSIHPTLKNSPVFDLCLVALAGLKLNFPFQVDVPCGKEAVIQIGIKGPDRHIQFRVVCEDLVRGLSLRDQRGNNHVLLMELMFCHVDTRAGIMKTLPVFPVSKPCIITVFMGDGTVVYGFGTSVTDIGSLVKTAAALLYKVRAGLVAGRTGGAFHLTEDDLMTHICLSAMVAVDTEVMGVIKGAFMIPVTKAVGPDLLGDGGRVFTEIFGDLLKRESLV